MTKVLGLTLVGLLALCLLGSVVGGTWAFFSDTGTSSNNQFSAGSLNLKTNDVDGVTQTLYATNMAPGGSVGPSTIQLRNAGTCNGSTLNMGLTYVESDGSPNAVNMNSDNTAAMMELTTLNYNGSSLLGSVADSNANGYKDIHDLRNASLTGLSGIDAGATKSVQIAVRLESSTGNDYQADGIDLTLTFTLNQ
jgi:spore coat-associated protein N